MAQRAFATSAKVPYRRRENNGEVLYLTFHSFFNVNHTAHWWRFSYSIFFPISLRIFIFFPRLIFLPSRNLNGLSFLNRRRQNSKSGRVSYVTGLTRRTGFRGRVLFCEATSDILAGLPKVCSSFVQFQLTWISVNFLFILRCSFQSNSLEL